MPEAEHKLVLSTYGEKDENSYLDPVSNQILTVDHTKLVVTEVADGDEVDDERNTVRDALQQAANDYLYQHYEDEQSAASVFIVEDDYVICISATTVDAKNFYSGRWRSVWRVAFEDDSNAKLSGVMKIHCHYYEDGNVQMSTTGEHGESVKAKSSDAIYTSIFAAIKKIESGYQLKIDDTMDRLSSASGGFFRALRRQLPMTGEPMDFASSTHTMAKEFNKKK